MWTRTDTAFRFAILISLLAIGTTFAQTVPRGLTSSPDVSSSFAPSPDASSPDAPRHSIPSLALENRPTAYSTWTNTGTALLWSVGATVLPVWAGVRMFDGSTSTAFLGGVLLLGGLAAGPSAGQWSLGSGLQGGLGTLIRVPGMFLVLAGVAQSVGSAFCGMDFGGNSDDSQCPEDDGGREIRTGICIYLAGALYSLIDIPFAAQRKQERESRFGLSPILLPGAGGGTSQGLVAWARF